MPPDGYTIQRDAPAKAGPAFGIVRVADLQGTDPPARRWCVPEWVPDLNVTSIYGDGGTGKSILAMQLATACAAGGEWLGNPVAPRKVLYVSCEDDRDEMHRRQVKINAVMGAEYGDFGDRLLWKVQAGRDSVLMTHDKSGRPRATKFAEDLRRFCREQGVRLLILDTAADTFGGNEIVRAEVRQFLSYLRRIALDIDGAVVLLAHPSAAGMREGSGYSGSTAWRGSVRSMLTFQFEGGEDADPDRRILTRQKANYAKTGTALSVRYLGGAFVAEHAPTESPSLMDALQDEALFERGLWKALDAGMCPSTSSRNEFYAPRLAKRLLGKDGDTVTVGRLTAAMERMLEKGDVIVQHHWKGSKPLTPKAFDMATWGKRGGGK